MTASWDSHMVQLLSFVIIVNWPIIFIIDLLQKNFLVYWLYHNNSPMNGLGTRLECDQRIYSSYCAVLHIQKFMTAGINYNHAINHAGDEASTGHILELLSETNHWQYGKIPIPETPVQKSLRWAKSNKNIASYWLWMLTIMFHVVIYATFTSAMRRPM